MRTTSVSTMKRVALVTVLLLATFAPAVKAAGFRNCAELRAMHPEGVARTATAAKTTGAKLNAAVYRANANLDRDKDGVACEVIVRRTGITTESAAAWIQIGCLGWLLDKLALFPSGVTS